MNREKKEEANHHLLCVSSQSSLLVPLKPHYINLFSFFLRKEVYNIGLKLEEEKQVLKSNKKFQKNK